MSNGNQRMIAPSENRCRSTEGAMSTRPPKLAKGDGRLASPEPLAKRPQEKRETLKRWLHVWGPRRKRSRRPNR